MGQGRVERPPPDFQSGASTELASAPNSPTSLQPNGTESKTKHSQSTRTPEVHTKNIPA